MKLIFVNRYFAPDISATSQLLTELAQHLSGTGRQVHVVTSRQLYSDATSMLSSIQTIDGVRVHRVWTSRFGRSNLVGRSLDYATFYVTVGFELWRLVERGDVIIAKTDPPLVSVVAAWIARRRGARLVNWLQDVFPEVAQRLGVAPLRGWVGALARRLRDYSVRTASVNVVLGQRMAETVAGIDPAHRTSVVTIHNWSDGLLIRPRGSGGDRLRREWGLSGKFLVGYSGNMGRAHEFDTMLEAASDLRDLPDVVFVLVGGGKNRPWIEREVARRGLQASFRFHEYQPRERLAESLSTQDVHLVSLKPELEGLIVPSKFYGIAAAGRPTVFIGDADGEIARILRTAECGITVNVGDGTALARVIRALHADRHGIATMGANARRVFEERFDKPRAMSQWEEVLAQVGARR